MTTLEDRLADVVRSAVEDAVADLELPEPTTKPEESWRSRVWSVDPETRLALSEVAEALGCSERTVRRYTAGETDQPVLPHAKGPTGLTIRAGDLRTWIEDSEQAERFRRRAAGGSR